MTTLTDLAVDSLTIAGAAVVSSNSVAGALEVTGAVTCDTTLAVTGVTTLTGALVANGGIALPTPTAYDGGAGNTAISPALSCATLTKGSAGVNYTLAAPGANVGRSIRVWTTGAFTHVVTVTGLLGGTTMTFAAAVGNGFKLFAVSATVWVLESNNGCTQTA